MTLLKQWIHKWQKYKANLKDRSPNIHKIVHFMENLLGAFVIAMFLREFIVQSSLVFSGSMIPTMLVDDRLIVNKLVYKFNIPDRGDIVLFESPYNDGKEYVKRLIGMPGDRIKIDRGIVYINDQQLIFPGVVIKRDYSKMDELTIPDGHYFMMGDNRAHSLDSRYFGVVSHNDLIGEALFTSWPINQIRRIR